MSVVSVYITDAALQTRASCLHLADHQELVDDSRKRFYVDTQSRGHCNAIYYTYMSCISTQNHMVTLLLSLKHGEQT